MKVRWSLSGALVLCLATSLNAEAASKFTIRGAGFGHGVGMSQYGAYGYALHGWSYDDILAHYYTDTELGTSKGKAVRVLLQGSTSTSSFSGARSVNGKKLYPRQTYTVRHGSRSDQVALFGPRGTKVAAGTFLKVRNKTGKISLGGVGVYRGGLEYRASGTLGVQAVNAVSMEDYVRGVIARESPSSWPAEALKAQAVAARTYALTTSKGGNGWDQYPDTRSQVYGGVAAETAATDAATRATKGQVVTYDGKPVTTFFFSTSGGRTEDVENTDLGNEPLPWLKSVRDPYDDESPRHRWGPYTYSLGTIQGKLGSLVRGSFKGIDVISRGSSPRIVAADVVGTGGRTRVTGATLRAQLGLYDTWAFFSTIKSRSARLKRSNRSPRRGTTPEARQAALATHRLEGSVFPVTRREIVVQHRDGKRWRKVGEATVTRKGHFAFLGNEEGLYRVRYGRDTGPPVRLR